MEQMRRLLARAVEKPWGRTHLPSCFQAPEGRSIGEIWFEQSGGNDLPLLAKYLFTSEPLSIQVHPSSEGGGQAGAPRGKSECWLVIQADPGAQLGIGLKAPASEDRVRKAALDGSIETLLHWREVRAGDFIFVPAGTVHAVGAGVIILEVQQNSDVTYRLFDYGRPRPLHLEQGLAVADLAPTDPSYFIPRDDQADRILVSVPQFTVARISTDEGVGWMRDRQRWVLPISGSVEAGGRQAVEGECLLVAAGDQLIGGTQTVAIVAAVGEFHP
jgi:mannose-6-phosphate isomerase